MLKNKKILVIGLGLSGRAAAKFLLNKGAIVCGIDRDRELLNNHPHVRELVRLGLTVMHESDPLNVQQFDCIVVSPGVPTTHPHYAAALNAGIEIIGEIELACRFLHQPFLAITGTNGKTTTTLLVAHVLNFCGQKVRALGNVGVPLISEIDSVTENEILVVELSSFQLETLNSKVIDAGVILNITPDHLDRYPDMQAYAAAKCRIKECLKPNLPPMNGLDSNSFPLEARKNKGAIFLFEPTYREFKDLFKEDVPFTYGYSSSCTLYTDKEYVYVRNHKEFLLPEHLRGLESHDVENLMAAYALCKEKGVTSEQFLKAFATFKKPAHRVEFVRSFKEVTYYDDSKGTNIDAVIRAVRSLNGEIILIAGGVDKGAAYTPWIDAFNGRVKYILAIGQASSKIRQDLSRNIPIDEQSSLEEAVRKAASIAKPGQIVLLSPGCSSFDMFRDYAHRGDEFKRIVNALDLFQN